MQAAAEKLVFSDSSFDQVSRQIDLLLSRIQQSSKEELLFEIIDQIFSVDSVIQLRNILLFEFALKKMIEIQKVLPYDELFEKIKNRKEFEVLIIYIKYVQQCKSFVEESNMKYHKSVEQFLKEKLCKYLASIDQTYIWRIQYIQKHQEIKEIICLNSQYKHPNKKIQELDILNFNYQENYQRIRLIYDFLIKNRKMFPFLDFSEILIYWIFSIKGQNENEMHLIYQMIQELHIICYHNINQLAKPFGVFLDFLKYEYRDDENFDPRKSLKNFLSSFQEDQLVNLTEQTLWRGIINQPNAWHNTYKNLIMMTTDSKVSTVILLISQYMINQKIFASLQKVQENYIAGLYAYLKFQKTNVGAVQIIKLFIIGGNCSQIIYQKHTARLKQALLDNTIESDIRVQLYQIAQCLIKKYESTTETEPYKEFLKELQEKDSLYLQQQYSDEQIDQVLKQIDWLNFQAQQQEQQKANENKQQAPSANNVFFQVQTSNKTLRGLQNLGNTCYMNSYLQALYMTKEFRYRVFKISLNEVWHGSKQSLQDTSSQGSKMEIDENPNEKKSENNIGEEVKENNQEDEVKKANLQIIDKKTKAIQAQTVFQLQKLFSLLFKSKRMYINPQFFKRTLPDYFRNTFGQQDASEFGRIFLDQLETSIKNTNDNKLLDDYFIGQYEHTITCVKCQNKVVRKEKFLDISLSFFETQNKQIEFNELLQHNFKPELFEGDNKYDCSYCNEKNDARKDTLISYLPDYVILTLNRFQYDLKTFKKVKLLQQVSIQEEIHLQNYQKSFVETSNSNLNNDKDTSPLWSKNKMIDENAMVNEQTFTQNSEKMMIDEQQQNNECEDTEEQRIDKNIYQLYAIVVHRGSTAESGHYFTYTRDSASDNCNWVLFDDSQITVQENLDKILSTFSTESTSTPYLLFYQNKHHALNYQSNFNENTYKLSEGLIFSIENDDKNFMKEMEHQTKAYSLLSKLNFSHQATQPNFSAYTYKKDDDDDSQGGSYQGGGFGGMSGNNAIF